jgi:hypothetical protein
LLFLANSSAYSSSHIVSVLCVRVRIIPSVVTADASIVIAVSAVMTTIHFGHCHVVRSLRHPNTIRELGGEMIFHLRSVHEVTRGVHGGCLHSVFFEE